MFGWLRISLKRELCAGRVAVLRGQKDGTEEKLGSDHQVSEYMKPM